MASVHSTEHNVRTLTFFQSSHSFEIFLHQVCRLLTLLFQNLTPLVAEVFLCEIYRFQKTSQTSGVQKNMHGFYDKVEMQRAKFIVAVVKILCSSRKFW